jgi:hypothetical protein
MNFMQAVKRVAGNAGKSDSFKLLRVTNDQVSAANPSGGASCAVDPPLDWQAAIDVQRILKLVEAGADAKIKRMKSSLQLSGSAGVFTLPVCDVKDAPNGKKAPSGWLPMPKELLVAVELVSYARSKDETKLNISGIVFSKEFVSGMDGHRAATVPAVHDIEGLLAGIPSCTIPYAALSGLDPEKDFEMAIVPGKSAVVVYVRQDDDLRWAYASLGAPNIKAVSESTNQHRHWVVDRQNLLDAVKSSMLIGSRDELILRLDFNGDRLKIACHAGDSEYEQELQATATPPATTKGVAATVCVNPQFLLQALGPTSGQTVKIAVGESLDIIAVDADDGYQALISPIRPT